MTIVSTSNWTVSGAVTTSAINTVGMTLLVIATANWNGGIGQDDAATPITDSASNTWTKIGVTDNTSAGARQYAELFYCANPTTSASHTFTYTTTNLSGSDNTTIAVLGWDGGSALDQGSNSSMSNSGNSSVTSFTTPQVTTVQASELLVSTASGGNGSSAYTVANGGSSSATWSIDENNAASAGTGQPLALGHALVALTGTYSTTWTAPAAARLQVGIASFKAAAGGAQDTPELYGPPRLTARQMQQLLAQ